MARANGLARGKVAVNDGPKNLARAIVHARKRTCAEIRIARSNHHMSNMALAAPHGKIPQQDT
jgi:hypothetical protein